MSTVSNKLPATITKHLFAIALLALLSAAIYSNTLAAPFTFDDAPNIENNPLIRIADLRPQTLWHAGMESRDNRPIAYMSIALNYHFGKYEARGYHIVNIIIHAIAGILVYLVAIDLFRRQWYQANKDAITRAPQIVALLAAAIFVAHPIQTQSVTYIIQRMSSMAATFCLLAFLLFILGRNREGLRRGIFWGASGFAWLLALGTKQTAMPLPMFLFLYEWYFRQNLSVAWLRSRMGLLLGTVAVMALVSIVFILSDDTTTYDAREFTLVERLLTQPRVVMRYIGLILFPHPLRLNLLHDVPVSHSLLDPPTTLLSLLALLAMFSLAIRLAPRFRLLSFCIVWFFASLAIESSFISLEMMFEHRLYLPMVGVSILVASGIHSAFRESTLWLAPISLGLIALLSLGTYQRNEVWQSKLALWEDTVAKSPNEYMALNNLGNELRDLGRLDDAAECYERSIAAFPKYYPARWNMAALSLDIGKNDRALEEFHAAVELRPESISVHRQLTKLFLAKSDWSRALEHAEEAHRLDPDRPGAMMRVAWILAKTPDPEQRDPERAVELAERANHLTEGTAPAMLDTLAIAYAAALRFEDAARIQRDLLQLELETGGPRVGVIRDRLEKYEASAGR
jgi:tetratricopeptide (TPR) repeat protein